jgi:methionine-rich copper-binding protein CopC
MKRFHATVLAWIMASAALTSPFAAAHALVKSSIPAAGSTVQVAPKAISITFNEKVEGAFSSVTVKDAAGKAVATGKAQVDTGNPATLLLDVPALASGVYRVQWTAVGNDGHRRTGDFQFTVK